ncbi:MAG: MFS transporter, partial [Pseudomonadota bacterium]
GAWAAVALLLAVAALPLVCGLAAAERPAESTSPAAAVRSGPARTRAQVLRDPLFPLVLLAVMPPALTGNTVFFHQAQLAAQRAWPPALFAAAFPLMAAATVVCSLAAGRWIDRAGALALLPLYALPMALGCGLLAGVSAPWAVFAFMALYGVSNGASLALFGSLWPQLYGSAHLGAIRSLVAGVLVTVSALGPGLAGLALDAGIALAHIVAGFGFYALAVSLLMAPVSRRLVAQACSRASSARAAVPTR